jgi:hypothetical protein
MHAAPGERNGVRCASMRAPCRRYGTEIRCAFPPFPNNKGESDVTQSLLTTLWAACLLTAVSIDAIGGPPNARPTPNLQRSCRAVWKWSGAVPCPGSRARHDLEVNLVDDAGRRIRLDTTTAAGAAGDLYALHGRRVAVNPGTRLRAYALERASLAVSAYAQMIKLVVPGSTTRYDPEEDRHVRSQSGGRCGQVSIHSVATDRSQPAWSVDAMNPPADIARNEGSMFKVADPGRRPNRSAVASRWKSSLAPRKDFG